MMRIEQKLANLIKDEVLREIEDYIDELFEKIVSKKDAKEDKETLKEMQEMKKEFEKILAEIESDELDEEECIELFNEIMDMRKEEE